MKVFLRNNFVILLFLHHIKTMMSSLTNSVLPIETRTETFIADPFFFFFLRARFELVPPYTLSRTLCTIYIT